MTSDSKSNKDSGWLSIFLSDYGMVFVLLLLCLLFSLQTLREQYPTDASAGKEVAQKILTQNAKSRVLVVTRDTVGDRKFAASAREALASGGANVVGVVSGQPIDVRKAIQALLDGGETIDAVAANSVTAKWPIYDKFESVGSEKCVTPTPYAWPDFLKLSNILNLANQTAIYAIIAIGMTMVIVTGGIDLGVGSLVALSAVTSTFVLREAGGENASIVSVLLASLLGVGICAIAGVFVGGTVTVFRVPSFIVTLAIMMMASGVAFRMTNGESIDKLPTAFFWIGQSRMLGVPNPVWLMIVLYVIAHVVMSRTVFGRYVYAIGGNEEASRLSGVPVKRVLLTVYTICGALAGLGGIVLASQLGAGDPKYGVMYELDVIAAVVVGGTSLMGGQGKIFGTLIGAFIIAVIKNGMNLTNVDPFNQKIVLGAVLLTAVLLDTPKGRSLASQIKKLSPIGKS